MLENQLFGVEVEMTGITREKAARIIADVLGTTPSRPESSCYHARTIAFQHFPICWVWMISKALKSGLHASRNTS